MGVTFICDGCHDPIEQTAAQRFGWVSYVWYCGACSKVWVDAQKEIDQARTAMVVEFQAKQQQIRATIRERMKQLPDE